MRVLLLANFIESNGFGITGQNIFVDMMPAEAKEAILLRSPLGGTKIDYDIPGYFRNAEFQLIVRSESYERGYDLIKAVVTALTLRETEIGSQYFQYCRPRTLPSAFPLSKGNLVEHTVMMDVNFSETV